MASFASGALLGSVAVSVRGGSQPARAMISALAWFGCLLVFAQMRSAWGGAAMLALAGFAQSISMVALAVVLLGIAGSKFRGRIMGVRMLAIYSLPLGALAGGALVELVGFRATGTLYALAGIALTLAIACAGAPTCGAPICRRTERERAPCRVTRIWVPRRATHAMLGSEWTHGENTPHRRRSQDHDGQARH